METVSLGVSLPADVYKSIIDAAQVLKCSPGEIITQTVKGNPPPQFIDLPKYLKDEVVTINALDDLALWQIAQGFTAKSLQVKLAEIVSGNESLQSENSQKDLDCAENSIEPSVARQAIATAILRWRGSAI